MSNPLTQLSPNLFIAGMGIPSCGKSSTLRLVAEKLGAKFFAEPEENSWPEAVLERDLSGCFSAITWFRSQRVPYYYKARFLADSGQLAIVDSYYDGLMKGLVGQAGMNWLIEKDDPYYSLVMDMAMKDWELLPKPDLMIFFELSYEDWKQMIEGRGRQLDQEQALLDSYPTQELFHRVGRDFCEQYHIKYLTYKQKFSTLEASASRLLSQLEKEMT